MAAGGTVALSVNAAGAAPLSYQWLLNGMPVAGATTPLLVLSQVTSSQAGTYTCAITSPSGVLVSGPAAVAIGPAAPSSRLINVSTHAPAGSGQNVLTTGFVISDPASKTVLIRAAGPALATFGITAPLPDPVLSLFSGTQPIGQNAGWVGDPQIATAAASVLVKVLKSRDPDRAERKMREHVRFGLKAQLEALQRMTHALPAICRIPPRTRGKNGEQ